jgi:uncharacterized iron-regulated membrane protein
MLKPSVLAAIILTLAAVATHQAAAQVAATHEGLYTPPDTKGLENWRGNGIAPDDDPFDDDYQASRRRMKASASSDSAANAAAATANNGWTFGRYERYIALQIAGLGFLCAVASAVYLWRRRVNRLAPAELALGIVREQESSRRLAKPATDATTDRKAA